MKQQLLYKLLLLLLLSPFHLWAQPPAVAQRDITGIWKGALYNDTTKKFLPYEIAISEDGGKLSGYSYTLFDIEGKKELGVKRIKIRRKDDQVTIEDIELISNTYSAPPPRRVKMESMVFLSVNDTALLLTGKWSTNRTKEYLPLTGSLQLQRANDYEPVILFKILEALKLDRELSFVKAEKQQGADIAIIKKPEQTFDQKPTTVVEVRDSALKEIKPDEKAVITTEVEMPKIISEPPLLAGENSKDIAVKTSFKINAQPINAMAINAGVEPVVPEIERFKIITVQQLLTDKKSAELAVKNSFEINAQPVNAMAINAGVEPVAPEIESFKIITVQQLLTDKKSGELAVRNPFKINDNPLSEMLINARVEPILPEIERTKTIAAPQLLAGKKSMELAMRNPFKIKAKPLGEMALKSRIAPKPYVAVLPEKKKEVMVVADADNKKEKNLANAEKPKAIVTALLPKKTELAKKENKPPAEIVKQTVAVEKPAIIPLKKDSLTSTVFTPVVQKKVMPVVLPAPPEPVAAANVAERKMKSEKSVFFESDSLVLTLYDNGEVDGDTVSVLINGKVIFARQGLSTKANSKTIYVDKDMKDSLSMVMYAENLGSIPPNTGLLIIMDGEKRYEVRFSADLQTNATILFRRKPKDK